MNINLRQKKIKLKRIKLTAPEDFFPHKKKFKKKAMEKTTPGNRSPV